MADFEHTSKFKADISNLKAGITKANRELKLIASEYKKASSAAELMGDKQKGLESKLKYLSDTLAKQKQKLENYKTQLNETKKYTDELQNKEKDLIVALENAEKKYGKNSEEVKKYNKELTQCQKEIESNKKKIDDLNITINNQEAVCNNAEKSLNDYNNELQNMDDSVDDAVNSSNNLEDGLSSISGAVTAASQALSGVGQIVDDLTDKFESLLINGINAVVDGMKLLAENAFESGVSFESAMSQVVATMGLDKASQDYEKLAEAAKYYGANTKFSATEAAEALNYLALAGYKTEDAISLLPTILDLANAGGMDLASASDMVTDAMAALCLGMDEATSFTDQLAKASSNSNTSVSQLGEAILTIGNTAAGMKNGTVELATSLGVLANAGIKGAEGGTHLRNMLLSLESPTDKAAAVMEELGIQVYDADGNLNGLNDIFMQFSNAMSGFTQEQKDSVFATVFNKRDLASANYLLGACGEEFNNLANQLENSEGAAAKMAATMNDNLEGSVISLKSRIEGLGIAFYDKLQEPAREVVDSITNTIGNLIDEITNGNGLSGALDTISNSMKNFAGKLPELIDKHLPSLEKVFTGIATIIATIIDYLPTLIDNILPRLVDMIQNIITKLPDLMENVLPKAIDLVAWIIENLPTLLTILYSIKGIIAALQAVLSALGLSVLVSKIVEIFGAGGALASAGSAIAGVFSTIGGWIAGIGSALAGVGSTIVEVLSGPVGWIILVVTAIIALFTLLYNKCEPFKNFINDIGSSIKEFFTNLWSSIKEFSFSDFIDGIVEKATYLKDNWSTIWTNIKDTISLKISEIYNTVSEFITNLPNKILEGIGYIIGYVAGMFVNLLNYTKEFISNSWNSIVTFIQNLPTMIQNGYNTLKENCINFFTNMLISITTFISNTYTKVTTFLSNLPSMLATAFSNMILKLLEFKSNMESKINELFGKIKGFAEDVINKFKSIDLTQIGKDIIQGLINGINAKWQSLKDKINSFTSGIKKGFQDALDIHSPSRWMRDFIGRNLMKGLEIGIDSNMDGVLDSISNISNELLSSFDVDMFKDLNLGNVSNSISNKNGNSNSITNNNTNSVTYNPTFNYNKPLNSREIYRQNKNMLNSILSV